MMAREMLTKSELDCLGTGYIKDHISKQNHDIDIPISITNLIMQFYDLIFRLKLRK